MRRLISLCALAVLLLLALWALVFPRSASSEYRSRPLSKIASWIAQRPVSILCQEKDEPDLIIMLGAAAYTPGYIDSRGYFVPGTWSKIAWPYCDILHEIAMGVVDWTSRDPLDVGFSVLILAHEARHLRGPMRDDWALESKVECWAARHARYVASRLGASPEDAIRIRDQAIRAHLMLPEHYRAVPCRLPGS